MSEVDKIYGTLISRVSGIFRVGKSRISRMYNASIPSGGPSPPTPSSGTFYPAAASDDGTCLIANWNTAITFGKEQNVVGWLRQAAIRFTNVTIPQGSTIITAYITGHANLFYSSDTCNILLYFCAEDNAAAPVSCVTYNAKPLTSSVAWNNIPWFVPPTAYNTPELKSILQEVVNRAGWVSGNSVCSMFKNNGSSDYAFRGFVAYPTAIYPSLYVEWI